MCALSQSASIGQAPMMAAIHRKTRSAPVQTLALGGAAHRLFPDHSYTFRRRIDRLESQFLSTLCFTPEILK
ncbi:MAG: hypothetical protein WCO04_19610 [Pseudomonadota bacterium]